MRSKLTISIALVLSLAISVATQASGAESKRSPANHRIKAGHYEGASRAGHPVAFDITMEDGRAKVTNFDIAVATRCEWWGSPADDPGIRRHVVAIPDLNGRVNREGTLTVYETPDDDTEYDVFGSTRRRTAQLSVYVQGPFSVAGLPDPTSPLLCDNWEATYSAKRVGG